MAEERVQRRLAAILAADVAGYSRMMGENEEATLATLRQYRELIDGLIQTHQGRIFGSAGDSVVADFASPVEALRCAIKMQQDIDNRNRELPDKFRMRFRIGVNLGDVMEEGHDLLGDGINVAARLERLADPGGVCISRPVLDQVIGKFDCRFTDLGLKDVKNIARPIHVYRVQFCEAEASSASLEVPEKPSVAVLPFQNLSGDLEQEYFSDGITADIIAQLSRFRSLFVIARRSSFHYKGKSPKVQDIGRELGVQYIVEGSVRRAGDRVRITAELVEAEAGTYVWAERYDRKLEDIFAVQDEVTHMIVSALAGRLEDANRKRALRKNPETLSTYDLLLRGKHRLERGSKDDVLEARRMFEQAIERDPDYAAAYIELAETYFYEAISGWGMAPADAARRLFDLARKAAQLDDQDSRAHLCLAWAHWRVNSDYTMAQTEVEEAIALNPNDVDNYCLKGWMCTCAGDLEEGISCASQAVRHTPNMPDDCLYTRVVAEYLLGRFEQALATFGRMTHPADEVWAWIAACYAQLGRDAEARAAGAEFRKSATGSGLTSDDAEAWDAYWLKRFPSKDAAGRKLLFEGLAKAGLMQ
jgi:adenylate cyclase